jgi:hypothetical protein
MPEWVEHIADRIRVWAFDYSDRSDRERLALARARAEYPGRAAELRRLEVVQRWQRKSGRAR